MATLLMFPPKVHFDDDNGDPLVGGKVFTYEPGTSTPKDTYADKAQVATNTNPVILDARGEAEIWLDGEYKIVVKDTNDVEIYTVDNASTEGETNVTTFSEWLTTGDTPTFVGTTQFSVPTDLTATYHVGRRVRLVQSSGTVYGVITATAFVTVTTVTVKLDTGVLDSGLSVSDVGLLSGQNYAYPINQILFGGKDYIADSGVADAYVATMNPPTPSYKNGTKVLVKISAANLTTTPTLNVNGLGAKTIKRQSGTALVVGDLPLNHIGEFVYDGTDFILENPATNLNASLAPGTVTQMVNVMDGAVATGSTVMVDDDTIPQNTEGDEYMTLAVTPKDTSNELKIEVVFNYNETSARVVVIALFQDTTANALAAIRIGDGSAIIGQGSFVFYMVAGTISATTFKVRAGVTTAGTINFNGVSAGVRKLGGVMASSITITEIKA